MVRLARGGDFPVPRLLCWSVGTLWYLWFTHQGHLGRAGLGGGGEQGSAKQERRSQDCTKDLSSVTLDATLGC